MTAPTPFTPDNYDPQRMLATVEQTIADARAKATAVAAVSGEGQSDNGYVTVRVSPMGTLIGVDLDPKAMRMPSMDLAAAIVAAAQAAQQHAAAQVAEIFGGQPGAFGLDFAALTSGQPQLDEELDRRLDQAREAVRKAM